MTNYGKKYKTDFLFSKPNSLTGAGSVFNLWGGYYKFNDSQTPQQANKKAFDSSWGVVGQSLSSLLKRLRNE